MPILIANPDSQYFVDETAERLPDNARLSSAPAVGDVDGHEDIFCANSTYYDQLFLNNGENIFLNVSSEYSPSIPSSISRSTNIVDPRAVDMFIRIRMEIG